MARRSKKDDDLLSTTAPAPSDPLDHDALSDGSADQHKAAPAPKPSPPATDAPSLNAPHQRQGDRDGGDDPAPARLPVFVRFADLKAANIVASHQQLYNLIDRDNFPPGVLLGPHTRSWLLDEVMEWLAARPTERKPAPPELLRFNREKQKRFREKWTEGEEVRCLKKGADQRPSS
jgi:predicted DNA-binding transcriptional regulator AlpA